MNTRSSMFLITTLILLFLFLTVSLIHRPDFHTEELGFSDYFTRVRIQEVPTLTLRPLDKEFKDE